MDPIYAHFNHRAKIPRLSLYQMPNQSKTLVGHLIDLSQKPIFIFRAKTANAQHIVIDDTVDLCLKARGKV